MLFPLSGVEKCAKEKNIHFSFISVQPKNLNIKNEKNRDFRISFAEKNKSVAISFIRVNVVDS